MPPSARRSQKSRRDTRKDNAAPSVDVEDSSPTRPVKRRRKATDASAASVSTATSGAQPPAAAPNPTPSTDPIEEDESALGAGNDGDQLVSRIVQYLVSPKDQPVQASKDHSNAIHEANKDGVKAYAKIAAQDWTYYVTNLEVNIGRGSDPPASQPAAAAAAAEPSDDSVHIDLGPSKTVSRQHAVIFFDSKEEQWFFRVKGRNGARIDGDLVKIGGVRPLKSGEVFEIGAVEMMFVLPTEISPIHVHETYLQRAGIKPSEMPGQAPALPAPSSDLPSSIARPTRNSQQQQQAIAPAPPNYRRPGTPPSAARRRTTLVQMTSPHPPGSATSFGAPLEIDLSKDENRHIKPQFSYAQMITQAILNTPAGKLNLNGIYTFIIDNYAYYRFQEAAGWQNSIRHNLSLNKSFEKVARSTDEPGKGMKWQLVAEYKEEMIRNAYKGGRGGHRGSSAPSSPSHLSYITMTKDPTSARKRKLSPITSPPQRSSLATAAQATPDRTRAGAARRNMAPLPSDGSPLPRPRKPVPNAAPSSSLYQDQSPTLASSFLQDENASFVTPAPPRVHPRLAPPSTAPRPSQHMPTSSPAPFWKYADIGSTPLRPGGVSGHFDASPSKGMSVGGLIPPSSSPPPRPARSPVTSPSRGPSGAGNEGGGQDVEDEQGFDLARGFQSISSYHAPVSKGLPIARATEDGF